MTYHGIVILLSGYQADEAHIIKQYRAIVEKCGRLPFKSRNFADKICSIDKRYPHGSLWILNRVRFLSSIQLTGLTVDIGQDFAHVV